MKKVELCLALLLVLLGNSLARGLHYEFIKVADETTQATPGHTFSSFNQFASIDDGLASFYANWDNLSHRGIFTGNGGNLTEIAQTGDASPIGPLPIFVGSHSIDNGTVAFVSSNSSTGAVFLGDGGPLTMLAKEGDPAPTGTFSSFASPQIVGDTAVFTASYQNFQRSGIFRYSSGTLSPLIKSGDPAPIGTFTELLAPSFDGEQTAFLGRYDGGTREGIFLIGNGAPTPLVVVGDAAPTGTFTGFEFGLSLHDQTVAFNATFGPASEIGIFTTDGNSLTKIVQTGDPAPIGTFGEISIPFTNGQTTVFLASYDDFNHRGIFLGNGGPLQKLIAQGDSLFGGEVTSLGSMGFSNIDIDSQGNVVFLYRLTDGREGVAIARLVPEPSAFSLVVLTGLCWLGVRYCRSEVCRV